jgi:regulator of cell morphogenesis and NO signaling
MKLFTSGTRMADVIHGNYLLLPVISRFRISLGFGEETVGDTCRKHGIDIEFFLAIINAFTSETYFPQKKLKTVNILTIVEYLEKTHVYYTRKQLPLLERLMAKLEKSRTINRKNFDLIRTFFEGYKKELVDHLKREDRKTFPYVKRIYRICHADPAARRKDKMFPRYSMQIYKREHNDVDEKLFDLKNILIKYIRPGEDEDLLNEIIFELFRLERDIMDHTRIENKILLPLVSHMERALRPQMPGGSTKRASSGSAGTSIQPGNGKITKKEIDAEREYDGLSLRELEVLQLVACGDINKEIADKLKISLHTVISHRKNISEKLQIKTVPGLTIYAFLNNLISYKI